MTPTLTPERRAENSGEVSAEHIVAMFDGTLNLNPAQIIGVNRGYLSEASRHLKQQAAALAEAEKQLADVQSRYENLLTQLGD